MNTVLCLLVAGTTIAHDADYNHPCSFDVISFKYREKCAFQVKYLNDQKYHVTLELKSLFDVSEIKFIFY